MANAESAVVANAPTSVWPGHVMLVVRTAHDHDWQRVREALFAQGVAVEPLHAADVAQNLDALHRGEEVGDEAATAARAAAWQAVLRDDATTVGQRAVAPLLQALLDPAIAQDPRLAEVERIAAAEEAFWRAAVAGKVAPPNGGPLLGGLQGDLRMRRWLAARVAFDRVRTVCSDIATHAEGIAGRARDARAAARYAELARRCRTAIAAIDATLTC